MQDTTSKPWYLSKTLWVNGVSLIVALATFFAADSLGLPSEVTKWATIVLGVANVVNLWLRSISTRPVAFRSPKPPPAAGDASTNYEDYV